MDINFLILELGYAENHLYSTLQAAGGIDVSDVIFEGGPEKCGEGGVNFSLKSRDVIYGRPLCSIVLPRTAAIGLTV